jgi:hypothetical protein
VLLGEASYWVGLKGAAGYANPDDASTAANEVSEAHSERMLER